MRDGAVHGSVRGRVLFVLLMQCVVVLACVGITTAIAVAVQERSIRQATVERVSAVAESMAGLEQVRAGVQLPLAQATRALQPLADLVADSSGVDYVVLIDTSGLRITHPTASERGLPVSTDPTGVLAGERFVGTEDGTLGPTLRAKVPVVVGDDVVAAVSVGILEARMAEDFTEALGGLLPWVAASVVVGLVVSVALTALIRRRVGRLEEESRELRAQRRIAAALRDQTHEFHTRLHVIRGLVAEGEAAAALDYISGIAPVTTAVAGAETIDDPRLRALLEASASALAERHGTLTVDPRTRVDAGALSDDDLIVVSNLCRNAVEAARSRVHVLVRVDETDVHIETADDGPGIAPSDAARLFQRGVSTKPDAASRGVGLDLVLRVVTRRGGSIEVGTSEDGGALFTVDMPQTGAAP